MKEKIFTAITLLLMTTAVLGESSTRGLKTLEKELQEAIEKENTVHSDFKAVFAKTDEKVKKYEEKQRNDNISTASLGRIEQLKLKAEKYSFELQLRRNIVNEMKVMEKLIDKWAAIKKEIASLRKEIKFQKQLNASMNLQRLKSENDVVEGAPLILDKDIERFWTVQEPSTLKHLAELIWSDESRWQDLYNINKDKLSDNPSDIVIKGTELIVPTPKQAKMFADYNQRVDAKAKANDKTKKTEKTEK